MSIKSPSPLWLPPRSPWVPPYDWNWHRQPRLWRPGLWRDLPQQAAVVYDNSNVGRSVNQTSFGVTLNINLSSLANPAIAVLVFSESSTSYASITISGAGVGTYTLVSGTDIIQGGQEVRIYGGVAPSSGSQTVTVGGMPASGNWGFAVITASGVDQATPLINGTGTAAPDPGPVSTTVTTAVGHLVVNVVSTNISTSISKNGDATQAQLFQQTFGSGDIAAVSTDAVASGTSAVVAWTTGSHGDWANAAADFQPFVPTVAAFAFSDTMMPQYQVRTTRVMI